MLDSVTIWALVTLQTLTTHAGSLLSAGADLLLRTEPGAPASLSWHCGGTVGSVTRRCFLCPVHSAVFSILIRLNR